MSISISEMQDNFLERVYQLNSRKLLDRAKLTPEKIDRVFRFRDNAAQKQSSHFELVSRNEYILQRNEELRAIKERNTNFFKARSEVKEVYNRNRYFVDRYLKENFQKQASPSLSQSKENFLKALEIVSERVNKNDANRLQSDKQAIDNYKKISNSEQHKKDRLLKESFRQYEMRDVKFKETVKRDLTNQIIKNKEQDNKIVPDKSYSQTLQQEFKPQIVKNKVSTLNAMNSRDQGLNKYSDDFVARIHNKNEQRAVNGKQALDAMQIERVYHQYKTMEQYAKKNNLDFQTLMQNSNYKISEQKREEFKNKPLVRTQIDEKSYASLKQACEAQTRAVQERFAGYHQRLLAYKQTPNKEQNQEIKEIPGKQEAMHQSNLKQEQKSQKVQSVSNKSGAVQPTHASQKGYANNIDEPAKTQITERKSKTINPNNLERQQQVENAQKQLQKDMQENQRKSKKQRI